MNYNYDINKQKIIEDYYKCIGAFNNCDILYYRQKVLFDEKVSSYEQQAIKNGMEEDLLSNLGKVGEKIFKYIIGLENIKLSPNQDSNAFESLWKKDKSLKEFALKHGIKENDARLVSLLNYYDENNQKAHNFDYWYSVMDLIMKDFSRKLEKFMEYNIQSDMLFEYCKENNDFREDIFLNNGREEISLPFRAAIFPNILNLEYESIPTITDSQLKAILNSNRESIRKNGDIFTRLRYASNNQGHKTFNLDEVYNIIKNLITFIEIIHENNDDLDFDLIKSYGKLKALEYSEYLGLSKVEINNIFSLDLTGIELELMIFDGNYSYKTIKDLLNIGVPKNKLMSVMREGLQARHILYFTNIGITDFKKMRFMLDYYNEKGDFPTLKK